MQEPNGLVFALYFLPATSYIKELHIASLSKGFGYAKQKFIAHLPLGYRPSHA
ncbi:hypothetical protein [Bacillus toyonensis]|uniref:hypothetical protein n=1 Tax=Bacillus toyonensis TaxID=155322 RepID=UPI0015C51098|nr:hypothetical protein [Bacillus toyonensis]MED3201277.1 hypothetical protein [Bacillus toyonensis]